MLPPRGLLAHPRSLPQLFSWLLSKLFHLPLPSPLSPLISLPLPPLIWLYLPSVQRRIKGMQATRGGSNPLSRLHNPIAPLLCATEGHVPPIGRVGRRGKSLRPSRP